jgi:phosphoglycolate phosphatase-like HAD superfamily hydrolase
MLIVLFDIDGTLIGSGGAGKLALERALVDVFGSLKPIEGVPYSGRTDRAIVTDLFAHFEVEDNETNHLRIRAAYLDHLPAALKEQQGQILPGIPVLLERLAVRESTGIGLLTGNVREGARLKLSHFGLDHHFAFGGYGDHHTSRNDVARIALDEAIRHLELGDAEIEVCVVGDTPDDVSCARSIGARVVAVASGIHDAEELAASGPDILLTDLSDATSLWEMWGES